MYKLKQGSSGRLSQQQNIMHNKFFSIKVKQQLYLGRLAIAIYISDSTKKVREKMLQL